MAIPVLDPSEAGVSLPELAGLAAMMAGAVSGALVSWISRHSVLLSLCSFLLGIMGGMSIGTGMGNLLYVSPDGVESLVNVGHGSVFSVLWAGLAGAIPTAIVMSLLIGFLALRHLKPRPPRVRTVLDGALAGAAMGTLAAVVWTLI